MRALLFALLVSVSLLPIRAGAQASDIQGIISNQIEAFKADDFSTAFTFAHPNIQNIFRDAENFGRMVRQGYPMVWRPEEVEYLDLRIENGRTLQDVRIVDGQGRVHVLEYSMQETDDGWRISGVRILESNELSA